MPLDNATNPIASPYTNTSNAQTIYLRGENEIEEAVVSQDYVGCPLTSNFDANAGIELSPTFFKIISWYDNEYGYSTKLVELIHKIHNS